MINRLLQAIIILSLLGIILVLFNSGAQATGPVFFREDYKLDNNQAVSFQDIGAARTFEAELGRNGTADFYTFNAKKDDIITARLNIPRLDKLDNFRPALALMGPGLPAPSREDLTNLPFTVPADFGIVISEDDLKRLPTTRPQVDEPYTQTGYWEGQSLARSLPQNGNYYLVVFSRTGQTGKYSLTTGDRSEAGVRETLTFPVTWVRLKLWFGHTPALALLLIGLIILIGLVFRLVFQSFTQK